MKILRSRIGIACAATLAGAFALADEHSNPPDCGDSIQSGCVDTDSGD